MTHPALEWSYNPWRERPARAAYGLAALLLCCGLTAALGLPVLVTLGLCLACAASLGNAVLPMRCRLDPDGVTRRSAWLAERRPWSVLRRAVRTEEGVLLSPFGRRHWLDSYRALFLPLPARQGALADDVDRFLASHGL
jgi:hypothetical protein